MIVPREYQKLPVVEVACPGGTLFVEFMDRDRVRVYTKDQRDYDLGIPNRKLNYTVRGAYVVNNVDHRVDAEYRLLKGDELRAYWHPRNDGEMPPEGWMLYRQPEGKLPWQREDYTFTRKWVTDKAYLRLKNEVYEAMMWAVSMGPELLEDAHAAHVNNTLAEIEINIAVREREIAKLYVSMNDIV